MPVEGWGTRTLGQLLALEYGAGLLEAARSGTGFPVYGSSGLVGWHREYLVEGPGIVVGRKGTVGAVVWSEEAFWPIDTAYYVQLRENHDLRWVYWRLSSLPLDRLESSTGVPGLNRNDAYTISIEVPPLPEQRRIAEILDVADDAIRQTERVIAKLKAVKAGLLRDLLTRGLDERGHLRDPQAHSEQFKDSPLGRIPREWEIVRLVDHVELPSGQVDPKQEPYRDWPLIAPDHIESSTGRLLNVQTAAEQNAISGKYTFQPSDVLYSKIRPYLRKAVLADRVGLCSADMYPLRPGPKLVPRFLLAIILGEDFSRFASSVSMRSGFPKINRDELSEYKTPLPTYEEQLRIVVVLEAHDARIRAEEAELAKLRQVKHGLMDDLLTGRVRVTSGRESR